MVIISWCPKIAELVLEYAVKLQIVLVRIGDMTSWMPYKITALTGSAQGKVLRVTVPENLTKFWGSLIHDFILNVTWSVMSTYAIIKGQTADWTKDISFCVFSFAFVQESALILFTILIFELVAIKSSFIIPSVATYPNTSPKIIGCRGMDDMTRGWKMSYLNSGSYDDTHEEIGNDTGNCHH